MELYPAIDLRGGRCVRLTRGDYEAETVYGEDPVELAVGFADAGARWIHVVDLDAARTGEPGNRAAIGAVVAAVSPHGVRVQCGGGVRSVDAALALWDAGVERVVLGTAAVEDPGLAATLAKRRPNGVAIGLDTRAGEVAMRGWVEGSGLGVAEVLARVMPEDRPAGIGAVIVTDIGRDGTLGGPDLAGLSSALELTASTDLDVIASGGVGSVEDLEALAVLRVGERRLAGAIVGRAIYEGRLSVAEGVAACALCG